jgi:hypothetical protein
VQLFQVVIIKYKKKLNQGLVYATLCGGPHLQVDTGNRVQDSARLQ